MTFERKTLVHVVNSAGGTVKYLSPGDKYFFPGGVLVTLGKISWTFDPAQSMSVSDFLIDVFKVVATKVKAEG